VAALSSDPTALQYVHADLRGKAAEALSVGPELWLKGHQLQRELVAITTAHGLWQARRNARVAVADTFVGHLAVVTRAAGRIQARARARAARRTVEQRRAALERAAEAGWGRLERALQVPARAIAWPPRRRRAAESGRARLRAVD
jgi:hypothetical protein